MRRHAHQASWRMWGRRQWYDDDASVIPCLWRRHRRIASLTTHVNNITKNKNEKKTVSPPIPLVLEEMRQRLRADSSLHQHEGWNKAWEERLTPWDLGGPTPALISELANDFVRNSQWWSDRTSLRTLVPGCGAGYDLTTLINYHDQIMISKSQDDHKDGIFHHHESVVVGLDIAPLSLERAKLVLLQNDETRKGDDDSGNGSKTRMELVMGNFFDRSSWETVASNTSMDRHNGHTTKDPPFDFVFDYTFFCALPPTLRPAWGEQISTLLHPHHGRLLTFIFPIMPGAELIGPPYPVSVSDYEEVLHPWGLELEYDGPYESPDTIPSRQGKEMMAWWKRRK